MSSRGGDIFALDVTYRVEGLFDRCFSSCLSELLWRMRCLGRVAVRSRSRKQRVAHCFLQCLSTGLSGSTITRFTTTLPSLKLFNLLAHPTTRVEWFVLRVGVCASHCVTCFSGDAEPVMVDSDTLRSVLLSRRSFFSPSDCCCGVVLQVIKRCCHDEICSRRQRTLAIRTATMVI